MRYFISLGSNIGDKRKNLSDAVLHLVKNRIKILKKSSLYETSPVGFTEQPWFLNQVLEVETELLPEFFLLVAKGIEKKMGRRSTTAKGPRCIDIDILLAEDKIIQTSRLQIPHPELINRKFVLTPLMEIAPKIIHPLLHRKIEDLWKECRDSSAVHLFKCYDPDTLLSRQHRTNKSSRKEA